MGEERCLPAWTRRRSEAGRLWRRARRVDRVDIEVDGGRVRGIVDVPETSLTKICIVSSSEACELMLEMLLERRMMVCRGMEDEGMVGLTPRLTARGSDGEHLSVWRAPIRYPRRVVVVESRGRADGSL